MADFRFDESKIMARCDGMLTNAPFTRDSRIVGIAQQARHAVPGI